MMGLFSSRSKKQETKERPPFGVFSPEDAKGGISVDPKKTAMLCIEFQNEFATEGGKLFGAVKPIMDSTNMLENAAKTAEAVRCAGGKVFHTPIVFKKDASDNPNKGLGILAGCAKDELFTEGTWNADFCEPMKPKEGDVEIMGKRGLDAFPNTTLEAELIKHGIETLAVCGFLTNCCVESTMRTACEKGFNVVTLPDCCATLSEAGQNAAKNETFPMFSTPMSAEEFQAKLAPPAAEAPAAEAPAAEAPAAEPADAQ